MMTSKIKYISTLLLVCFYFSACSTKVSIDTEKTLSQKEIKSRKSEIENIQKKLFFSKDKNIYIAILYNFLQLKLENNRNLMYYLNISGFGLIKYSLAKIKHEKYFIKNEFILLEQYVNSKLKFISKSIDGYVVESDKANNKTIESIFIKNRKLYKHLLTNKYFVYFGNMNNINNVYLPIHQKILIEYDVTLDGKKYSYISTNYNGSQKHGWIETKYLSKDVLCLSNLYSKANLPIYSTNGVNTVIGKLYYADRIEVYERKPLRYKNPHSGLYESAYFYYAKIIKNNGEIFYGYLSAYPKYYIECNT